MNIVGPLYPTTNSSKTKEEKQKMNTRPKTFYLMLGALVIASMLLSSCGKAKPTLPASSTAAPSAPQGEKVNLDIWVFEGENAVFDSLIASFEADNPNIDVVVTDFPEADYTTKIDTALIAGEPPDLGFIYEPKWIKAGEFLPLDDMIAKQGIKTADFNQGAWGRDCVLNGKVYCIGTYTGVILLFYNKDIFDVAGVAYPSATEPMTMDEYAEMCAKVTKKSDVLEEKVWGCDADIPIWWQDWRNFISPDGHMVNGYVNDAATIHSIEALLKLRTDGSVISASDSVSMEGTDLLATGKLATTIVDNVIAIATLETAGINWGAALVPVEQTGDETWVTGWTDGYGVFSASKHPQEALTFLAYMGTKGQQVRLDLGDLPLNITFADQWAGDSVGRQEAVTAIRFARPNLFVPGYWDTMDPLYDGFYGAIIEDGRPVKDVLDEIAPQMQDTLNQAWETWDSIK
jgi:multiple sugar transport system substrate-binding protein